MYRPWHFSARNLCSDELYLKNSNLCASQGVIGPISDILHASNIKLQVTAEESLDEEQIGDIEDWPEEDEEEFDEILDDLEGTIDG